MITPRCHSRCILDTTSKKNQNIKNVQSPTGAIHAAVYGCSVIVVSGLYSLSTLEKLSFLNNVLHDWNAQSAINLHYGLVSPCLVGANWNRLRQLLLTASLMAANERHLCAVDPYEEEDHVVAQSEQLNIKSRFSISHQSTASSSILTECCPETNLRVWTCSCSSNGLPLASWNNPHAYRRITKWYTCMSALHGNNRFSVIAIKPPYSSVIINNSREQRGWCTKRWLAHLWFESFSLFSVRKATLKWEQWSKTGSDLETYAFPHATVLMLRWTPGCNFQAIFYYGAKTEPLPVQHNCQWTQAVLLIDCLGLY